MVTQDRPGGIHSPMTVEEVERAAGVPVSPALHGGTPYVKRPPERVENFMEVANCIAPRINRDWYKGGPELFDPTDLPMAIDPPLRSPVGPEPPEYTGIDPEKPNPKTLVGRTKVPMLSVIPETALVHLARALQYGAFFAPRKDTTTLGYGPKNWRDQSIEYMTYIDAAFRHLLAAADGEDIDPDAGDLAVGHLEEAMATLAILIDARVQGTCIDNRHTIPRQRGVVGQMLRSLREKV